MTRAARVQPAVAACALLLSAACVPAVPDSGEPAPQAEPGPPRFEERAGFARAFRDAGAVGTFVLVDPAASSVLVHDSTRARERFLPASTFKVLNALVALETGVVADTAEVFRWDGAERSVPQWNGDHTLATALEYSVVWAFQDVARRVGETRMRDYVQRADYGNADIGGGIDRFWLTGDLRISALEQVLFLQRLHERRVPFSERSVALVEGIMVEERTGGAVLRAKSGWADLDSADPTQTDLGWYVGFVERDGRAVYFALNLDLERPEQAALRRSITRTILSGLGLF